MVFFCNSDYSFIYVVSDKNYLTIIASLIGATALIYVAKGEPMGQILTVVFSVFLFRYILLNFVITEK